MNKDKEIEKINRCIDDLVYDKVQLKKAYNYYHCVRDAEQFKHIEDNFGIGTPTSIGFTPLIKKHIDVLVGEYLELDPDMQISCKDEQTISNIMRDKQLAIDSEVFKVFKDKLENSIMAVFAEDAKPVNDPFFDGELARIKKSISKSYISEYELAAQFILNYIKNSRDIDLKNKMRELFTDLLIGGVCYYRTKPSGGNNNLVLEVLNPLNTFVERNQNEFYLNRSPRAVIRRWLTRDQILAEFGDKLNNDARGKLNSSDERYVDYTKDTYVRNVSVSFVTGEGKESTVSSPASNLLGGLEAVPVYPLDNNSPYSYSRNNLIEVYECEWIEFEKDKLTRHSGVKIGSEIYITNGENEDVIRSVSDPKLCTLSINGMFFSDKNGNPFSIVANTMDLQDRYDLLIYYRDNLIATSGTVGDWVDVAHLPTFLGEDTAEQLEKWGAYKKNGYALYDSSQEGSQVVNTMFNGYDDTVKGQSIQAIELAIQSVEEQASSITGVFREKLGGIQQRDAVSNVKVGVRQSTLLTKQYFSAMDLMYKEVNYDLLNLSKIVYKNGISGTLILGNRLSKIFTAKPEYYTMTDFDIHIQDSTELFQARQTIQATGVELVKAGAADPSMLVSMAMAKNLTELRDYVNEALESKKQENDTMGKMQQQMEQMNQQIKQYEQQLKQLQSQNEKLNREVQQNGQAKIALDKKRIEIEEQEMRNQKEYNDRMAKTKERQVDIEVMQLTDGNPYNDKIKNV